MACDLEYKIVKTELGTIRGLVNKSEDKSCCTFKGIPYAQPPVGALRFLVSPINYFLRYNLFTPFRKCIVWIS